jgi:hypothetical protein
MYFSECGVKIWKTKLQFYPIYYTLSHDRWVPCHHGMVHPQVADGGDSLQFWRVAANMLNK